MYKCCCVAPIRTSLLKVRQATAHVTSRRSTHPRFTSTSPILTRLCAVHRLTPTHPSSQSALISGRAAVESVNSWREGFRGARTGSMSHDQEFWSCNFYRSLRLDAQMPRWSLSIIRYGHAVVWKSNIGLLYRYTTQIGSL